MQGDSGRDGDGHGGRSDRESGKRGRAARTLLILDAATGSKQQTE
jgi:hypothetical protein